MYPHPRKGGRLSATAAILSNLGESWYAREAGFRLQGSAHTRSGQFVFAKSQNRREAESSTTGGRVHSQHMYRVVVVQIRPMFTVLVVSHA
jgi:hypothetical protein